MRTINFKKLGILLVMMLVCGTVLVGPVSANWGYKTVSYYTSGAYAAYSNDVYGFIFRGDADSDAGSVYIEINLKALGTDAETPPEYQTSGTASYILTQPNGYYSDDEVNLREAPYNPRTQNHAYINSVSVISNALP